MLKIAFASCCLRYLVAPIVLLQVASGAPIRASLSGHHSVGSQGPKHPGLAEQRFVFDLDLDGRLMPPHTGLSDGRESGPLLKKRFGLSPLPGYDDVMKELYAPTPDMHTYFGFFNSDTQGGEGGDGGGNGNGNGGDLRVGTPWSERPPTQANTRRSIGTGRGTGRRKGTGTLRDPISLSSGVSSDSLSTPAAAFGSVGIPSSTFAWTGPGRGASWPRFVGSSSSSSFGLEEDDDGDGVTAVAARAPIPAPVRGTTVLVPGAAVQSRGATSPPPPPTSDTQDTDPARTL